MAAPGFPTSYTQLWGHTRIGDVVDADTTFPGGLTADDPLEELFQYAVENGGGGAGNAEVQESADQNPEDPAASTYQFWIRQDTGQAWFNTGTAWVEIGPGGVSEAAVVSALDGATLTAVTVASDDKVTVQDTSDSNNLRTVTAQEIADLGGGGSLDVATTYTSARDVATTKYPIFMGPSSSVGGGNITATAGRYTLGFQDVRPGTPSSAFIAVATAAAGSTMHAVIYDVDEAGLPTTVLWDSGPIDVTATGQRSVSGLSTGIPTGRYLVGCFTPTGNANNPVVRGFSPGAQIPLNDVSGEFSRVAMQTGDTGHATPQDLSAFTYGTSAGATTFAATSTFIASVWGSDA